MRLSGALFGFAGAVAGIGLGVLSVWAQSLTTCGRVILTVLFVGAPLIIVWYAFKAVWRENFKRFRDALGIMRHLLDLVWKEWPVQHAKDWRERAKEATRPQRMKRPHDASLRYWARDEGPEEGTPERDILDFARVVYGEFGKQILGAQFLVFDTTRRTLTDLADTWDYLRLIPPFRGAIKKDVVVDGYRPLLRMLGYLEIALAEDVGFSPAPYEGWRRLMDRLNV